MRAYLSHLVVQRWHFCHGSCLGNHGDSSLTWAAAARVSPLLFTEEKAARVTAPNQTKLWIRVLPATSFGTQFRFYGCLCCWVRLTSWHILLNCWKCEERLIMKWNVGKRASILQNTKEGRRVCPRLRDSTLLRGQHGRAGAHSNLDRGNPSCINTTAKVNKVTFVPLV